MTAALSPAPVPAGFHTVTPHLVVHKAAEAIEFYKEAFGARELERQVTPDGRSVLHAELRLGDSILMMCDEFPGDEAPKAPRTVHGTTITLHIYTAEVDLAFARAVAAGCRVQMPLTDTLWGDRFGILRDPYGHSWSLASRIAEPGGPGTDLAGGATAAGEGGRDVSC